MSGASVHSCIPLRCFLETEVSTTLRGDITEFQREEPISSRHSRTSSIHFRPSKRHKSFITVLFCTKKNSSLPSSQQPARGFLLEAADCTAYTFTPWFISRQLMLLNGRAYGSVFQFATLWHVLVQAGGPKLGRASVTSYQEKRHNVVSFNIRKTLRSTGLSSVEPTQSNKRCFSHHK